jgi:3-oxoacyl-[acyl-carrier-protein] synthase-1
VKATWVTRVGARSPQGFSALQVATAARVMALAPSPTPFVDTRGARVGMSRVSAIPDDVTGADRLVRLALPALREAIGPGSAGHPPPDKEPVHVVLALPASERPDSTSDLGALVLAGLEARLERPFDRASTVVRAGHAGGAIALQAAVRKAAEEQHVVVVGGVDSYYHPDVLRWLDEEDRLHAVATRDGFVPGEAAAFAVLRVAEQKSLGTRPLARVVAVEHELEPTTGTGQPNLARGLTAVVHRLLAAAGEVRWVIGDQNGESHRNREWSAVLTRAQEALAQAHDLSIPQVAGDVGAATGPLALAIACGLWSAGCAPSARCLVALASDGVDRGGFVLEEPA